MYNPDNDSLAGFYFIFKIMIPFIMILVVIMNTNNIANIYHSIKSWYRKKYLALRNKCKKLPKGVIRFLFILYKIAKAVTFPVKLIAIVIFWTIFIILASIGIVIGLIFSVVTSFKDSSNTYENGYYDDTPTPRDKAFNDSCKTGILSMLAIFSSPFWVPYALGAISYGIRGGLSLALAGGFGVMVFVITLFGSILAPITFILGAVAEDYVIRKKMSNYGYYELSDKENKYVADVITSEVISAGITNYLSKK